MSADYIGYLDAYIAASSEAAESRTYQVIRMPTLRPLEGQNVHPEAD
jgi:hypothetical protein